MHLLRQPNGKWRVQVRRKVGGEFIQKSKTFEFKSEAEAWGFEMERELQSTIMLLDDAFNLYIEEVIKPKLETLETERSRKTLKARLCTIRSVQQAVGRHTVEGFGPVELKQYMDQRLKDVSPATVRKDVYHISAVYEFLIKDHLITGLTNPVRLVRLPVEPKGRTVVHKPEDRLAISNHLSGEPLAVYELLLETACRVSEIVYLRREWLDLDRRVINLPHTATKTRESRQVPLSRRAAEILSEWAGEETAGRVFTMHPDSIRNAYARARKACGREHLRLHDCRHTKITEMVSKATNLFEVMEVSGHSSVKMLERYTHLQDKNLHHLMD